MKRALLAAQMREVEAAAASHGVSSAILMGRAGTLLAQEARGLSSSTGRFVVMAGVGNNGGDGLVAALALLGEGRRVSVELIGDQQKLSAALQALVAELARASVLPGPIADELKVGAGDVVIDALFGTGLSRALEPVFAKAISRIAGMRASGAKVLSADLPSGVNGDTGEALQPSVSADRTVAFGFLKVGQSIEPGASHSGDVRVVDIGMPVAAHSVMVGPATFLLEEADALQRLLPRSSDSHKGTFGHLLVVAGSHGKTGAAALAGTAALRAGAGLVTVASRADALPAVLGYAPELMGLTLSSQGPLGRADLKALLKAAEGKDAVVIGPGIEASDDTGRMLGALLAELEVPCLLDADALNALAGQVHLFAKARGPLVLTPHPGEMARLTGTTAKDVNAARVAIARQVAMANRAVVVLKGARTVVARPDGTVFINPTGNPGMATGGSGDVLAGICGALLAQGLSAGDAAITATYAHGLAGDLQVKQTGQLGLVASDLLTGLQQVWVRWGR